MYPATQMMMFNVPANTLVHMTLTGLAEMLVVGMIFGLTIKT